MASKLRLSLLATAVALGSTSAAVAEPQSPALRLALGKSFNPFSAPSAADLEDTRFDLGGQRLNGDRALTFQRAPARMAPDQSFRLDPQARETERRTLSVEMSFSAPSRETGLGLDVAVAPRAGFSLADGGALRSTGAEVRLGKRLESLVRPFEKATWDRPAWYFYAATDGQALTWTPEAVDAGARRGVQFQDERIMVGDAQIGMSMEARDFQASLALVQREVSNGQESVRETFLGATFALRH